MRLSSLFLSALVLSGLSFAQDTSFQAGPQYLITNQANQFLRPIATPSLALDAPLPAIPSLPDVGTTVENQPYVPTLNPSEGPNLFPIYYGYPEIPVVQLVSESGSAPPAVPAAVNTVVIVSTASVVHTPTADTLGEIAAFWKAHRIPASRVYSNAEIERFPVTQSTARRDGL